MSLVYYFFGTQCSTNSRNFKSSSSMAHRSDQTVSISSAKWLMSDLLEWMRRTQRLLPESAYRRCVMLCTMVLFHFTSRPTNTHLSWIISYSACDCETGWFVYWMELWEVSRPRLICDRLIKSLKHNQVMDISASDHLRVLPVTISSDLSVDKHVANVCSSGFYWLCQLRRVTIPRHRIQDAHPCLRHVVCGLL